MRQSHPFLICLPCPPPIPVSTSASVPQYRGHRGPRTQPGTPFRAQPDTAFTELSRSLCLCSWCLFSPVGSFAIVDQSADIAHKRAMIQNPPAAYTASLWPLDHGARTVPCAVCEGAALESPDLVAVQSRWRETDAPRVRHQRWGKCSYLTFL